MCLDNWKRSHQMNKQMLYLSKNESIITETEWTTKMVGEPK